MDATLKVSLVIPVFNESATIVDLLHTIKSQTAPPEEIIIVDGGSTDNTAQITADFIKANLGFKLIKTGRAMPGEGRNIGTANAKCEWIAYTDAGIKLTPEWLHQLADIAKKNPEASIVYGNYAPEITNVFERAATIAYVPAQKRGSIRNKTIVSCLIKKNVWVATGGFPGWRAAEDLAFMEKAEQLGYSFVEAPDAMVYWQLRPGLRSTYKKFALYSKHNVWANRQKYWHYGVARQYLVLLPFIAAGIFHSWYWLLALPAWIIARATKRVWIHRHQFGIKILFNPLIFFLVSLILLVIDAATIIGWVKAILTPPKRH